MRKDEITYHREGYAGDGVPAVNVKVDFPRDYRPLMLEAAKANGYDVELVGAWYDELEAEDPDLDALEWTFDAACEYAWDALDSDAKEIWDQGVKVYSEGRSGGWAIVKGISDPEGWDAVELAKWAKFAKYAREYADGIPFDMATLAIINTYERYQDEIDRRVTA